MTTLQTLENRLRDLLGPAVAGLGYELVDVEWVSGDQALLRLYIDQEAGIGLEDCARVSHEAGALLDVEDPIAQEYRLEVSSPGLDRPLVTAAHFQRFVGSLAKVKLHQPQDGRRNFKGRITACDAVVLTLDVDGESVALPLADLERARLVPEI